MHRERLDAILDNAVDAIITIDQSGQIQSANPATERMFGYSTEELVGQNVKVLMPNPFRDQHDGYLRNYLETGQRKIIGIGREVVAKRRNGSVFPVHLAVSEIRFDDQRMFTGVIRDISDLKSVEAQLVQSERLAAIGQMVAGLAHESRNAFQRSHACLANLELDVRDMPESLELVRKVQSALDHLNSLLDEVRDYAAPIILERSQVELESLIRDTWRQICRANPSANAVVFTIECSEDFPKLIKADRRRFEQLVWNLLENARLACEGGRNDPKKIDVGLSTVMDHNDQPWHCVSVSDNGDGIDPKIFDSLFQPFFTTRTRGTGLGLAICQRIVDAHHGRLAARNNQQGGATFEIRTLGELASRKSPQP